MKNLVIISFFFSSVCLASGNYNTPSRSSSPSTIRSSNIAPNYKPQKRSASSIKNTIYSWDKKSVSVHNITANDEDFTVEGSFKDESDFNSFVEKIKGSDKRKILNIDKKRKTFAGTVTNDFEVKATNMW